MKQKTKIGLSTLIPIAAVGSVAPLATACSQTSIIKHVHASAIDSQYGLNENTYKLLKKDYETKVINAMINQGIPKDSKLWQSKMSDLQYAFNIFDNKASSTSMSYATLTSSLMNYARKTDNISLRRITNTKWSDINALFQGAYDSFDLYMSHEHFSEEKKAQVLYDATLQFNAKIAELESDGYKQNDPFGALLVIRDNIVNFFDSVNDRICYLSSQMRLANFNNKYSIKYRALEESSAYLSIWNEVNAAKGQIIPNDLFNKLFYLVDDSTGETIQFQSSLLIPGYTLRPKLVSCSADEKSNVFKIELDLGLIKTSYLNSNDEVKINKMTAHTLKLQENVGIVDHSGDIYKALDENRDLSDDEDFFNLTNKLPVETLSFNLWNKLSDETNAIKDYYFNTSKPEYIRFRWPDASSENASFDPFINKIPNDGSTHTTFVGLTELAQAGLEMSQDGVTWYPLAKVILSSVNKKTQNTMNAYIPEAQLETTLMEEFIYNCELTSQAKYVEHGDSYEIQHKFYVKFNETSSLKTLTGMYNVDDEFILGKCENFKISQHEFIKASSNYSEIGRLVAQYNSESSDIKTIEKEIIGWITSFAAFEAFLGGCMIPLFIRALKTPNANDIIALISGATGISACIHGQIILARMLKPVQNYLDKLQLIIKNEAIISLFNKIQELLNTFTVVDEQGNYDEKDAADKNVKFQALTFKNQWNSVSYLTTLFQPGHDGAVFKQLLEDYNVGNDAVGELKNMFSTKNDEFNKVIGHTVAAFAASLEVAQALFLQKGESNKKESPESIESPESNELKSEYKQIKYSSDEYISPEEAEAIQKRSKKLQDEINNQWTHYKEQFREIGNSGDLIRYNPDQYLELELKMDAFDDQITGHLNKAFFEQYPEEIHDPKYLNQWMNKMSKFANPDSIHHDIIKIDALRWTMDDLAPSLTYTDATGWIYKEAHAGYEQLKAEWDKIMGRIRKNFDFKTENLFFILPKK